MKRPLLLSALVVVVVIGGGVVRAQPAPPVAHREPHPLTLHGRTLEDDYFWMRKKDSPEVIAHLKAENAYTDAMLKPTEPLQQRLYHEMKARLDETDTSVPHEEGGYLYYRKFLTGKQYPVYCRKAAPNGAEEVLLDLNDVAAKNKFVGLDVAQPSDDGKQLAYSIDLTGFRFYGLRFKNLAAHTDYPEEIPRVESVAWAADNKTIFYVVEDQVSTRPYRLYKHVVGTDPKSDPLLYEEKDERYYVKIEKTRSRAYLILTLYSKLTTEVRYLAADRPDDAFKPIAGRNELHQYFVDHRGDKFYIRTNSPSEAGGPATRNFRLVTAPVDHPTRDRWTELVAHRPDVMLQDVQLFKDHAVLLERADALPRLTILRFTDNHRESVKLPEPLYTVDAEPNREFDSHHYRFSYESPMTPETIYDYDVETRALKSLKVEKVLGGYDPTRYTASRTFATAADGTRIPISLVYRKDLKAGTPHPMLLYGYGSYGSVRPLYFSSERVSLLDRGVVWALAHVRGGGDLGKRWHEQGRLHTKMNTFTDFIACAEELVKQRWTSPDKLAAEGRSAGGLLMGAISNLRPDLFRVIVAGMPFVDVINTMLDESLPEVTTEFEEWGNPKVKSDFDYMVQYSPYDNVAKKNYPSMLVLTSYNDSEVMYWEPTKWVARLRRMKTDRNPLLLHINMQPAGHGGQSGRFDRLRDTAMLYAFLLTQLGVEPSRSIR
jgi:oligopeptidase B